jgi:hypothetical protein
MSRHASEYFTFPGRILVLLTVLLAVGGPFAYFALVWEDLPPGSYPLLLFAMPFLILAALFFGLGVAVLRWFDVKVFKDAEDTP